MSLDILEMLYYCFIIIIFNVLGIYLEVGIIMCALGQLWVRSFLNVAIGFSIE